MTFPRSSVACAAILASMASAAFADSVTLDVTAWKGSETEPAGLPQLIAHSRLPTLKSMSNSATSAVWTRTLFLPPRLQGNNAPDVMMTDMPLVKIWSDAGLLADLGTESGCWQGRRRAETFDHQRRCHLHHAA